MFSPRIGSNTKLSWDFTTEQKALRSTEAAIGDLEYRAVAVRPAGEVVPNRSPWAIGDQVAIRFGTVGAVKTDQGGRRAGVAGGVSAISNTVPRPFAPPLCCAEQVAVGIGDQIPQAAPLVPLKLTRVVGVDFLMPVVELSVRLNVYFPTMLPRPRHRRLCSPTSRGCCCHRPC